MNSTRREFITKGALSASFLAGGVSCCKSDSKPDNGSIEDKYKLLDEVVTIPVLKSELFFESFDY